MRSTKKQTKKVFFLKGKSTGALVAEMQLFAAFPVEVEQIPLYLTEITAYQQEEQKMEAAEAELSYDWKQILKEHLTNEELQSYKVQIQNQSLRIPVHNPEVYQKLHSVYPHRILPACHHRYIDIWFCICSGCCFDYCLSTV